MLWTTTILSAEVLYTCHTISHAVADMHFIPSFFCLYSGFFFIIHFQICTLLWIYNYRIWVEGKWRRNRDHGFFLLKEGERNSQFFDKNEKSWQVGNIASLGFSSNFYVSRWLFHKSNSLKSWSSIITKSIREKKKNALISVASRDRPFKIFFLSTVNCIWI